MTARDGIISAVLVVGAATLPATLRAQHARDPAPGTPPVTSSAKDNHVVPAAKPAAARSRRRDDAEALKAAVEQIVQKIKELPPPPDTPRPPAPRAAAVPPRIRLFWRIALTWPEDLRDNPPSQDERILLSWR